jgi:hypothetical protein
MVSLSNFWLNHKAASLMTAGAEAAFGHSILNSDKINKLFIAAKHPMCNLKGMKFFSAKFLPALVVALPIVAMIPSASAQLSEQWQIGPVIRGKNYSLGMPLHPTGDEKRWHFDFPHPTVERGSVHYITMPHGPLAGKSEILVRYKVEARPEVRFVSSEFSDLPGIISIYFQRKSDTWTARGRYQFYRWYAPATSVQDLSPGVHEIRVSLNDPAWVSVMGRLSGEHPMEFAQALKNIERVGLVFGSRKARGHGAFATGWARFTLLGFEVR